MIKISKQQIDERWDALSVSLREILYSPIYSDMAWKIGEEHHLDDKKTGVVLGLTGNIIMGFIHLDDLAKEISSALNLNLEIANSISKELDKKIFFSFREEINKNYRPPTLELLSTRQSINEIRPSFIKTSAGKPQGTISPLDILKEAPSASKPPMASPVPSALSATPIAPVIPITPKPTIPSTPSVLSAEGPLIIHKETEFKPLSENRKSLGGFFNFLNKDQKEKKEILSPVKARVEIGPEMFGVKKEEKKEPEKTATAAPKVRVVHYTDFPAPLASDPFSGKIQPKIQDAVLPPKPTVPPIQKPPMPFQPQFQPQPQPQIQPKPQSPQPSLRDLTMPISPVSPTPSATPPMPKRVDFSVDETNDSTKKNNNLGENIIDLRSFK